MLRIRTIVYFLAAAAVAAAIRFTPRLPEAPQPAEVLTVEAATPSWRLRFDTLGRGETLQSVLRRGGLTDSAARIALGAATSIDHRRIPAGMPITIRSEHPDSAPSEVTLQLAIDRIVTLRRTGEQWAGAEEVLPWKTDTIVVGGAIRSTLYEAMDESAGELLPKGARRQLTWSLADVFEYRVDMSRDLQQGDEFKVLAERSVAPNGAVKIERILAATLAVRGNVLRAIRFGSTSVSGDYFDGDGRSMRAAFLRAPLDFRRISSSFGFRTHPVLGNRRLHRGTDYAASSGTPVRAIGDGVVVRAGWGNGYGNVLEIRHPNGYVTRYGHLKGFAKGVRVGTRVGIGKTVAYVGSTGLSTGPHLHFEVLVGGVQRDPRQALQRTGGLPIPSGERASFSTQRDRLLASLGGVTSGVAVLGTTGVAQAIPGDSTVPAPLRPR